MTTSNRGFTFSATNQLLTTTVAVGATSYAVNGFTFDATGNLHVLDSAPAATDPLNGGLAFKPTGELYVTTAAVSDPHHCGLFQATDDGRAYVADLGTIAFYKNGIGFTSTGQAVTVNTP